MESMPKRVNTEAPARERKILEEQISTYCHQKKKIICKSLGRRPIFLDRYLECTLNRKDKNKRMPFFFAAVELLKASTEYIEKQIDGKICFEFL